jgi:hypothetical protein
LDERFAVILDSADMLKQNEYGGALNALFESTNGEREREREFFSFGERSDADVRNFSLE